VNYDDGTEETSSQFKTKRRHTISKVLWTSCKTFNIDEEKYHEYAKPYEDIRLTNHSIGLSCSASRMAIYLNALGIRRSVIWVLNPRQCFIFFPVRKRGRKKKVKENMNSNIWMHVI
jgi:hypothetical protein